MTEEMNPTISNTVRFPSKLEIAGIIVAALPFVCNFSFTSSTTINGVTTRSHIDYVAIPAGIIAVVLGVSVLALLGKTADEDRLKRLGAVVVIAGLGVLQLLRGFGIVWL